jgi:hypothetical protein
MRAPRGDGAVRRLYKNGRLQVPRFHKELIMIMIHVKKFCTTHDRGEVHVHAPLRSSRSIWRMALAFLATMSVAAPAGAFPLFQGSSIQGTMAHGAGTTSSAPVQVSSGAMAETQAQPVRLEITHVAGDTIHAIMWSDGDGEGRAARLHPRELVGLTWTAEECDAGRCETISYRIAGTARDTSTSTMPRHGDNSDIWLYRLEYALAHSAGEWQNACEGASPDMGIFVDGRWFADGTWKPGGWTFSCPRGVISKCVRAWGYKPWKTLRSPVHGEVSLLRLYLACTRAALAEYCGDGISHTRDGTLVDMFDIYGFNVPENVPGFREESVFDEYGALWVSVPRWPTAAPTRTGWDFQSCELPRRAPQQAASALIHVWSDPTKGRAPK